MAAADPFAHLRKRDPLGEAGAVLLVVLLLAAGIAGACFGATGRVDLAAPFVCPAGTSRTTVRTVVTNDGDGVVTNYYLDCLDRSGRATRVSTLSLLLVLYGMVAVPSLVLALAGLGVRACVRDRQ